MNPFKGRAFKGQTINHYVVADALDMLEFLFEYSNDPCLKVEKWTKDDLQLLKTENLIIDSTAKEIMRGMKEHMSPIQEGLNIHSISVEWAVHVPDCTTFFVTLFYAYDKELMGE